MDIFRFVVNRADAVVATDDKNPSHKDRADVRVTKMFAGKVPW